MSTSSHTKCNSEHRRNRNSLNYQTKENSQGYQLFLSFLLQKVSFRFIYGEPIYVQETATKEEENKIREQLKNVLLDLYKI